MLSTKDIAMNRQDPLDLFRLGTEIWWLGIESAIVMGARAMVLAGGGAKAQAETQRMVSEKLGALAEAQAALMSGAWGLAPVPAMRKAVAMYSGKVGRNRRRLG